MQQLTHECERLKEEESKRQAMTSQLQQLQSECEHLRKKQEESECERLKERQALTSQMQEIQSECESLRKRQEESERERLKEESQRQAITLQLQALQLQQLQSEKLKKKESKFNSLVARAQSLKSKVEQFCNECEKCDAEDASSDSSWELCTVMTEGSGISVDTAGRCFMREAVFKASEVSAWEVKLEPTDPTRGENFLILFVPTLNGSEYPIKFPRICWNTAGTIRVGLVDKFSAAKRTSNCNHKISKVHAIPTRIILSF